MGAAAQRHITWRHRGQPEDHRYRAIRRRNQPHFAWKSLYLVFGLQAVLAWVVALPLSATVLQPAPWNWLDAVGIALFTLGFLFEALADAQLHALPADPAHRGKVLATGLWRFAAIRTTSASAACGGGCGCWPLPPAPGGSMISPLLMTALLLKISGISLLERDITDRRPAYRDYMARTNAFFPGPVRSAR